MWVRKNGCSLRPLHLDRLPCRNNSRVINDQNLLACSTQRAVCPMNPGCCTLRSLGTLVRALGRVAGGSLFLLPPRRGRCRQEGRARAGGFSAAPMSPVKQGQHGILGLGMANPLLLSQPLDYESKKVHTVVVEALNKFVDPRFVDLGTFRDQTIVRVSVLDVDEPPEFRPPSNLMEVQEDAHVGSIVGVVTALDPDTANHPVR